MPLLNALQWLIYFINIFRAQLVLEACFNALKQIEKGYKLRTPENRTEYIKCVKMKRHQTST